ncbi:MAG: glutathione S-transferase family protein [Pseudomonadota bacterium]
MMSELVVYGAVYSVYSRVVRIALREKNLTHRWEETDIFDEGVRSVHRSRHPFGRIPFLQHADRTIIETSAILRYLDALHPAHRLFDADPAGVARSEPVIGVINAYAYPALVWQVYVPWSKNDARTLSAGGDGGRPNADMAAEVSRCLAFLDQALDGHGSFSGRPLGAADAFVYPVLAYFGCVPWGAAQIANYPNLAAWRRRMADRDSIRTTAFAAEPTP